MHDLVIRNGTVIDGTGAESRTSDIAINSETIVSAEGQAGPARREIDADGALVTPGWIDIHTHYDGQATWDPLISPSCWHGVTTAMMGNCGVGFAPVRPDAHDWLIGLMEGVEDIPGTALAEGIPWGWESFAEYLDVLDANPRAIDIAAQVPHGAVRAYVMGERGAAQAAATGDEITAMANIVRDGIAAGAMGFTTSRTALHRTIDGEPVPEMDAAAEELIGIGSVLGEFDHATFGLVSDFTDMDAEFAWMTKIAKTTGRHVWFLMAQTDRNPDMWRDMVDYCRAARAQGASVTAQVAGRPIGILLGLEARLHPFVTRDAYKEIAHLPLAERVAAMREPARRAAIIGQAVEHHDPIGRAIARDYHKMFPLADPPDYEPGPEASIAAAAQREGRDAAEVVYDRLLEDDGHALLFFPMFNYASGNHDTIREMLLDKSTMLGLGDGGAHCSVICDASNPTYVMNHWGRDRTRGEQLPIEWIVKQQTGAPAAFFGFSDRGTLAPGMRADINIIDFETLRPRRPEIVYDLPTGGRRFIQRADGYLATLVAGSVTFENGAHTGALPGRLVRAGQAARRAA